MPSTERKKKKVWYQLRMIHCSRYLPGIGKKIWNEHTSIIPPNKQKNK
jgi:hypothetical protein